MREFLEKNYTSEIASKDDQVIKLAVRALLEVVQGKNLEVAIMKHGTPMRLLSTTEVEAIVAQIEKEKEEAAQWINLIHIYQYDDFQSIHIVLMRRLEHKYESNLDSTGSFLGIEYFVFFGLVCNWEFLEPKIDKID